MTAARTNPATYVARNDRGAEIQIGMPGAEGSFTPIELLQAAIAGCTALSAEAQFVNRLGNDFDATATVKAQVNAEENRVVDFLAEIEADMSELDPKMQDKLIASSNRSIAKLCAIKRTLSHGVDGAVEVRAQE